MNADDCRRKYKRNIAISDSRIEAMFKRLKTDPDDLMAETTLQKYLKINDEQMAKLNRLQDPEPKAPDLNDIVSGDYEEFQEWKRKREKRKANASGKPEEMSRDDTLPSTDDDLSELMAPQSSKEFSLTEDNIADLTPTSAGAYRKPIVIKSERTLHDRMDTLKRTALYRQGTRKIIKELGAVCVTCGEKDIEVLRLDHKNGRSWHPNRYNLRQRLQILQSEHKRGDILQVLCERCNSIDGGKRTGKRNY